MATETKKQTKYRNHVYYHRNGIRDDCFWCRLETKLGMRDQRGRL